MAIKASVQKLLDAVTINGDKVKVPVSDWRVYQGHNDLSKAIDTLVGIPNADDDGYRFYRYSSKKRKWNFWREFDRLSLSAIKQSGSISDVVKITPVMPAKSVAPEKPVVVKKKPCVEAPVAAKPVRGAKKKMRFNLKQIFGRFGKTDKGEFALSLHGGVAVKNEEGGYSCLINDVLTNVEDLALDIDAFFYMPSPVKDLVVNDVVVTAGGSGVGFVTAVDEGGKWVDVYDINSQVVKKIRPAVHMLLPQPFVTKVLSIASGLGGFLGGGNGGAPGAGGFNPMMLLLLNGGGLGGDGEGGLSDMLPLMLLSGGLGGGAGGMNPLMLMLLLKDGGLSGGGEGGLSDMLPLMLLGGGLGGGAGVNPFGNLFGGAAAVGGCANGQHQEGCGH